MICAGITVVGFEDVCRKEMESLGAKNSVLGKGIVKFEVKTSLDLARIAYSARTASRVLLVLDEIPVGKDLKGVEKSLILSSRKIDILPFIKKEKNFKVECEREGSHEFTSSDFDNLLGKIIIQKCEEEYKFTPKVSMDNPDVIVYANIRDENCVYGVDFCGFDISKRDYHIFVSKTAIRGTIGACLTMYADAAPKKTILDTFTSSGSIAIEAALISKNVSPNFFRKEEFVFRKIDSLKKIDWDDFFKKIDKKKKGRSWSIIATDPILANVHSTEKNAKIAGVQKEIDASRVDIEWLDTKIGKKSVDFVISRMSSASRIHPEKEILKLYREFFYQLDYILKKGGKIVILIPDDKLFLSVAKEYKFEEKETREIMIGKLPMKVVTLVH